MARRGVQGVLKKCFVRTDNGRLGVLGALGSVSSDSL